MATIKVIHTQTNFQICSEPAKGQNCMAAAPDHIPFQPALQGRPHRSQRTAQGIVGRRGKVKRLPIHAG